MDKVHNVEVVMPGKWGGLRANVKWDISNNNFISMKNINFTFIDWLLPYIIML